MSDQLSHASTTTHPGDLSAVAKEPQQIGVVDDATLQAALSAMSETEMNQFLEDLNKTGKAFLPSIGQTIELLTVSTPAQAELPTTTTVAQPSADILLQEITSMMQQAPAELVTMQIDTRVAQPIVPRSGNTAVKSTVTSTNNQATIRKPIQQQQHQHQHQHQQQQQQMIQDERMFFGRPTTIGQGQYHNRTGLIPANKQQPMQGNLTQQQQQQLQQQQQQRRSMQMFPNRARRHSSEDEEDSDRDSSPPVSGNESLGPTRRSTRVPKPKQDADFVTFPLLDRDENGNPIGPTPSSIPSSKAEDDEDDIPYRLMDYPRPQQSHQNQSTQSMQTGGPGRKSRTTAEIRSASNTNNTNKKPARWPDDELYHVKSFVPLIMPQQLTNPSIMRNKMTLCKPVVSEREVEAKPTRCTIETQTEMEHMIPDVPLVTLPVPIYLPSPTPSYRLFKPKAVPIPVPFFVPIMIPVPRKTYKNIRDYLQSQRDLLPDDPYQAALVLHAESLVRAENRAQQNLDSTQESVMMMDIPRDDSFVSLVQTMENLPELDLEAHYIDPMTANDPEVQKLLRMLPDAAYRLKWVYGVEAFQRWAKLRNQPILTAAPEEAEIAQQYLIKTDLLSYVNGDELQQVLDVFIREVRRPTGETYLPESIYYLCLGIQYYLHMNNRSIDLFDPRCIEFNATLNTILLTHQPRISTDGQTVLSLIDEDLMYDVHQFGTLSPWALLTTLIYTYSKYFNLKNVDAHMAISFANFGKYSQWVRLTNASPQGQQMNYLRFYAHNPDLKSLANAPTVYEITEQTNDPARCPIKQYDFYVSKCPEHVRGTADVFYLRPLTDGLHENSLWFSNESLSPTIIDQILNRLKLLADFYHQTKPVETGSTTTTNATVTSTSNAPSN